MMVHIREFWFWYGLIVCPLLILASLFGLGYIIANTIYADAFVLDGIWSVSMIVIAACAAFELKRSIEIAKVKFKRELTL